MHETVKEQIDAKHVDFFAKKQENGELEFIEYLKSEDGGAVLNSNGEIIVEKLVGDSATIGYGSNQKDVYTIEKVREGVYYLKYYDKSGTSKTIVEINVLSSVTTN